MRMAASGSTRIMGIINCTPDSFYAESRRSGTAAAWAAAERMIADGADIIDIGGESTRPGSAEVAADEQIARTVPVIREIRSRSDVPLSIDTRSAPTAEAALDAGASMVNDVSALRDDERMGGLVAERGVPVVLMHMLGRPRTMQENPRYGDVVAEVREFFARRIDAALSRGVRKENIIIDPGIGFGKRPRDNVLLLRKLDELRPGGVRSMLIGLSRKSFLGRILDDDREALKARGQSPAAPGGPAGGFWPAGASGVSGRGYPPSEGASESSPSDRLTATLAAHAWCLAAGADILRVHDVKETRELIAVWEALAWAS